MRTLIEQRLGTARAPADPRERILANVVGEISAELRAAIEGSSREAAVLLALVERPGGLEVLFTERAAHLTHHPSQISFPGGRLEAPGESAVDAALREAHEEIGLDPGSVTIVGTFDAHVTGTGFRVTPVVGFVPETFVPRPDPAEVDGVFEVPLQFFLDPASLRETYRQRLGSRFRTYEFEYEGRVIWGATASILVTFRDLIK